MEVLVIASDSAAGASLLSVLARWGRHEIEPVTLAASRWKSERQAKKVVRRAAPACVVDLRFTHLLAAGDPLCVPAATPRPRTEGAALALATEERFAAYQASGGGSASMIDHYFDKLLQVARPPPALVRNAYLEEAAARGAAPLLAVVLAYGRTGEVPVAEIEAICERVGLRPVGK